MAVPPTPDGSVGPRSTSGSTVLTIAAAVLAVVCVACVVVLGVRLGDTSGSWRDRAGQLFGSRTAAAEAEVDDTKTREIVLSQASRFIVRINSYGPEDLDQQSRLPAYVTRVKEVITPKLAVEFEQSVNLAEETVAQAGLKRSAQVYASGASEIGPDTATVLVTGVITQSYPDPEAEAEEEGRIEFEPQLFRYEVVMVKTDGTWLADQFEPVVGEQEGEQTPGAEPTDTPTSGSGGATSPAAQSYARLVSGRGDDVAAAAGRLEDCGFPAPADAGSVTCRTAPDTLAAASRTLAVALRDAGDPDAAGYVAAPPQEVAQLVQVTRTAAANVVSASQVLSPSCVATASSACTDQRTVLSQAATDLVSALEVWESLG